METTTAKQTRNNTVAKSQTTERKAKAPAAPLADRIKIGLDVGLNKYACDRQVDGSLQEPPQMKSPEQAKIWMLKQKKYAKEVHVCYEAGFLGFELARWLQDNGIRCVVMAPVRLDESNKRVETDKTNARDILSRLDRFLSGNERALTRCRIPSRQEELDRHQTRQRDQLMESRRRVEAQGRSLCWEFGYLEEGQGKWWSEELWEKLQKTVEKTLVESLSRFREIILIIQKQITELLKVLEEKAQRALPEHVRQAPRGVGWLSLYTIQTEAMDLDRFKHRGSFGCFAGLVPSEASTGVSRRQGSITKVGNPVVRKLLVEMAWRMVHYQPDCRAVKKWKAVLQDPKDHRRRKRAIVAVARLLAVDLWRVWTKRTTFSKLGFV